MQQLVRIAGVLTLGYGAAIAVSPRLMAAPCELTERDGSVPPSTATMIRALGVRDVVSGLSLVLAPAGKALRIAGLVRVGSDVGDGLLLAGTLPSATARTKSAAVAIGWGALCAGAVAAAESGVERGSPRRGRKTRSTR